jgi:hypothetical protein
MDGQRAESIREWDARPAGEGYEGLHRLSREEFSGAVEGGSTWALMTNGRVVGVVDGAIESFESASLTAHAAPDDALPLLFAMQERGGETRAEYYTEETPVSAADRTLSEGGFTGYLELSENVLSGDYYVVYHGGRSSSVAFVGANERLVTGEEAFEAADDEVGIYRIVDVDVTVTEIPGAPDETTEEPSTGSGASAATSGTGTAESTTDGAVTAEEETAASGDATEDRPDESPTDESTEPTPDAKSTREHSTQSGPYSGGEEIRVGAGLEDDASADSPGSNDASPGGSETDPVPSVERDAPGASFEDDAGPASETASDAPDEPATPADDPTPADTSDTPPGPDDGSLDASPAAESDPAGEDTGPSDASAGSAPADAPPGPSTETAGEDVPPGDEDSDAVGAGASRAEPATETESETATEEPEAVRDLRATRDRLESELETVRERLSEVRAERDDALEETERLRERVAEIEARLEEQTEPEPERGLSAEEALSGTNLFVRYHSKGDPTLEAAHRGDADREAVEANLHVERHTTFEADGATVDGEPFDAFLSGSLEYRFVEWVIEDLLYELQATGNRGTMRGLYDLLPEIDRVELHGAVTAEEGEERAFDVVFRDRMGNPLAVADLHDSRDPAGGSAVGTLIEDAKWVVENESSLATAFHVTASYYDPPALERAANAVDSGFLSTSRHKSYVKLNRKQGFHLCLVEAREGAFGLNVPEL